MPAHYMGTGISQAAKLLYGMRVQKNKFLNVSTTNTIQLPIISQMQSDPMTTRTAYMFCKLSLYWRY